MESIAAALESGTINLRSSSLQLLDLPEVSTEKARLAAATFAHFPPDANPKGIALALRVANELRRVDQLDRPKIEIAWTGPQAGGPLVRPTRLVIEEMLQGVHDFGDILVVGYSLTIPGGSAMDRVVRLLEAASERKANVTLVLHRDESEENREGLMRAWSMTVKKPRILTWSPPPDHPYPKLHAKVLVVDRIEALVGSANLTFHGLESNLELGLRVRGPQAAAIAERFDHLEASGVLKPWD
ncbi:MAG: phospholipase D-like domain-containing protein [bacterium]